MEVKSKVTYTYQHPMNWITAKKYMTSLQFKRSKDNQK